MKYLLPLLLAFSLNAQTPPRPLAVAPPPVTNVNLTVTVEFPNTNVVRGLLLLWGPSPRTYTNSVRAGLVASVTISNVSPTAKLCFAAMTQDANLYYSPLSNELQWPVPTMELVFVRASTADTIDGQRTVEYTKVYTNPPGMKFTFLETWKETR